MAKGGVVRKADALKMMVGERLSKADALSPAPDVVETLTGEPIDTPEAEAGEGESAEAPSLLVAFALPAEAAAALAITGGEPIEKLHLTLAYCPYDGTPEQASRIEVAVGQWAAQSMPCWGVVTGGAVLVGGEEWACVALIDSYSIADLRESLVAHLQAVDIYPSTDHAFLPHITIGYVPTGSTITMPVPESIDIEFDTVGVALGDVVTHYRLLGPSLLSDDPILRADEERYTLAPLYSPGLDDTHGDSIDSVSLQRSAWDYFRSGDRDVRLQHLPDIVAGEVVELVTWPFEVTCELAKGDGSSEAVTLPPGTVYEGVVWRPWAYEAVKNGKLNGMSLGGRAKRHPVG